MSAFPGQPGHRELHVLLGARLIRRGLLLLGAGLASVAVAVVLSFVLTQLLPDRARFWGVLAFTALGLGFLLLGTGSLITARFRGTA